jgi:heterodisulfide reductase subunit A
MGKDDRKAYVNPAACTGCGVCSAACPVDAIDIAGYTDEQITAQVRAGLAGRREYPLIALFLCHWCSYAGADIAGVNKIQYPPNTRNVRLMCTGRFDPTFALDALQAGADGVLVAGCRHGECHYKDGNLQAMQRLSLLRTALTEIGLSPARIKETWISASEGGKLAKVIEEFANELRSLGPTGTELADKAVEDGGGAGTK